MGRDRCRRSSSRRRLLTTMRETSSMKNERQRDMEVAGVFVGPRPNHTAIGAAKGDRTRRPVALAR